MKTAFAMKLLDAIDNWPVATACDSALQVPFYWQARLPAMRAIRHLALMPACIGGLGGMGSLRGAAGRRAMAAGSTLDGGRLARRTG